MKLLSDTEVYELTRRRMKISMSAVAVGLALVFGMLLIGGEFIGYWKELIKLRWGQTASEWFPALWASSLIPLFIAPALLVSRKEKACRLSCPNCHSDITRWSGDILRSRSCPKCNMRILEGGKTRSALVMKRYRNRQLAPVLPLLLWVMLWVMPLFNAWILLDYWYDPQVLQRNEQIFFFVPAMLGVIVSGLSAFLNFKVRYLTTLIASTVLFCIGVTIYWRG